MAKKQKNPPTKEELDVLELYLKQLNGVLLCALAAFESDPQIPDALQGSLITAARLAKKAKEVL